MSFGLMLRALRHKKKLTLRDLSDRLKVDHSYLSRLENGSVPPSEKVLKHLARLFGIPTEELRVAAGKLPQDVANIFYEHPKEATSLLRERFAVYNTFIAPSNGIGSKKGLEPVFETSRGKLYHCDCLELLPTIPAESVDLVFADPPFNLRKNYGQLVDDDLDEERYLKWSYQWLDQLIQTH